MEIKPPHDPLSVALHAAYYDLSRALCRLEESETLTLSDVRSVREVVNAASGKLIALEQLMVGVVPPKSGD